MKKSSIKRKMESWIVIWIEFAPAAKRAALTGKGGIFQFEIMPKNVNKVVDTTIAVEGDVAANLEHLIPFIKPLPRTGISFFFLNCFLCHCFLSKNVLERYKSIFYLKNKFSSFKYLGYEMKNMAQTCSSFHVCLKRHGTSNKITSDLASFFMTFVTFHVFFITENPV